MMNRQRTKRRNLALRLSAFFALAFVLATTALSLTVVQPARAATIAVSIPLSGDFATLGRDFRNGLKLALDQSGADHALFIADDGCDPDLATLAASDIAQSGPDLAIGFLCNDPAIITANALQETGTPLLVAGARSVRLIKDRQREAWNLWRLSPGDDYAPRAAARAISELWQTTPYAIVDDGTIYGRSFTDSLRLFMDEAGLAPQFSDTFRAAQSTQAGLLRRLERSGVTAAFIASASQEDLFTIARNMKEFGIELDLITSEALQTLPFLQDGSEAAEGIKVVMTKQLGDEVSEFFADEENIEITEQFVYGYVAMQIALASLGDTVEETSANLKSKEFDTILGAFRFADDGSSTFNPYDVLEWNGEAFIPVNQEPETQ